MPRVFPVSRLRPLVGMLTTSAGTASLTIPIAPFFLTDVLPDEQAAITTTLELSMMTLPASVLAALVGQVLQFPKNPDDGYIDGSIYILGAHHPADVTSIRFGALTAAGLETELTVDLVFEFEGLGDFRNTRWVCTTTVQH